MWGSEAVGETDTQRLPFENFIHLWVLIKQLEASRGLELRKDAGGRPTGPVMSRAHAECLVHTIP